MLGHSPPSGAPNRQSDWLHQVFPIGFCQIGGLTLDPVWLVSALNMLDAFDAPISHVFITQLQRKTFLKLYEIEFPICLLLLKVMCL